MSDSFYRAFEDRFRGSRLDIKNRLQVYLPFVQPVAMFYPDAEVIDLGCGRGEWLELLQQNNVPAHGVDLDEGMLQACHEVGLTVYTSDAIKHLEAQPDESALVVTAFHLVEHIGFDAVRQLVAQAFRVLKPGGLLIMETPNPENIVVGTREFYLDPTHQRPIPPSLLSFVPQYYGYSGVKVLRLQESPALHGNTELSLNDVLGGASPDYAVVARKSSHPEIQNQMASAWHRQYGLSSEALAELYRHQSVLRINRVWGRIQQMDVQISTMRSLFAQTQTALLDTQAGFQQTQTALQEKKHQVEQIESTYTRELEKVYASRSWRVTAPLRWVDFQVERLRKEGLVSRLKALAHVVRRKVWRKVEIFLHTHPRWRVIVTNLSKKIGVHRILRQWHLNTIQADLVNPLDAMHKPIALENLTPEARAIRARLKKALNKRIEN
jgi:O-antigen chain-terminating methyltransferase